MIYPLSLSLQINLIRKQIHNKIYSSLWCHFSSFYYKTYSHICILSRILHKYSISTLNRVKNSTCLRNKYWRHAIFYKGISLYRTPYSFTLTGLYATPKYLRLNARTRRVRVLGSDITVSAIIRSKLYVQANLAGQSLRVSIFSINISAFRNRC